MNTITSKFISETQTNKNPYPICWYDEKGKVVFTIFKKNYDRQNKKKNS